MGAGRRGRPTAAGGDRSRRAAADSAPPASGWARSRSRGGRILALGEGLAAERVTGAFGLSDPDAALETIAATLGVSLTRMPLLAVVRRV